MAPARLAQVNWDLVLLVAQGSVSSTLQQESDNLHMAPHGRPALHAPPIDFFATYMHAHLVSQIQ